MKNHAATSKGLVHPPVTRLKPAEKPIVRFQLIYFAVRQTDAYMLKSHSLWMMNGTGIFPNLFGSAAFESITWKGTKFCSNMTHFIYHITAKFGHLWNNTSLLIDANDNFSWRILLWCPVLLDTSSALYFNINDHLDPNYILELAWKLWENYDRGQL